MDSSEIQVKVVLLGDTGVGKTSIAHNMARLNDIEELRPSVGVALTNIHSSYGGHAFDLRLWDTAGQEIYRSLPEQNVRNADISLLVFSISEEKSYTELSEFLRLARDWNPDIPLIFVGNKCDLEENRVIDRNAAASYADSFNGSYVEVSALTGFNIQVLLNTIMLKYLKAHPTQELRDNQDHIDLSQTKENGAKGCEC